MTAPLQLDRVRAGVESLRRFYEARTEAHQAEQEYQRIVSTPKTPTARPQRAPDGTATMTAAEMGSKGGKARQAQLSPAQRRALGLRASEARWGKRGSRAKARRKAAKV